MSSSGGSSNTDPSDVESFIIIILVVGIASLLAFWLFKKSIYVVRHAEVMVVERFGRYKTTLKPGWHMLLPLVESPRVINWRYVDTKNDLSTVMSVTTTRVDMREHVLDGGKQHVVTRDMVQMNIDALVYFRVTDPRIAVYQIQNLPDAVELLVQATLRNVIAQMTLDDTFSSREYINAELLTRTQRDAERWGVTITRVEIFNIIPPNDIKDAMENQIKSERERRSTVLRADGERESAIIRSRGEAAQVVLDAEATRASSLLRAKGQAEAKTLLAKAEADNVRAIKAAVTEYGVRAVDYLSAVEYLHSLARLGAGPQSSVTLVPVEASNMVGAFMGLNRVPRAQ